MGQAPAGAVLLISEPADIDDLQVNDPDKLAFVTQTTLSVDDTRAVVDALKARFPNIIGPKREDICSATSNRQEAVKELAQRCNVVLVIGSKNSSNSNRLREVAERAGSRACLIDGPEDIQLEWFSSDSIVGITAGASAPEILVNRVTGWLDEHGFSNVSTLTVKEENVSFTLPESLR